MVPTRSAAVLALLSCALPALAQPAPRLQDLLALDASKCSFSQGGKPFAGRVLEPYVCAYLRASVIDAEKRFDALPSLAAQDAFLEDASERATAAHKDYQAKMDQLIKETDPAKVDASLPSVERAAKLEALDKSLWEKGAEIAKPFLWPPREEDTYLQKTVGYWPKDWDPYLQNPLWDRHQELENQIKAVQESLVQTELAEEGVKVKGAVQGGESGLSKLFDGGSAAAPLAVDLAGGAPHGASLKLSGAGAGAATLKTADLPIPADKDMRAKRDYFSRGTEEGLKRLSDEAQIAVWHLTGKSHTVGDPYGKAALDFSQSGPSCAVASQYEAMRARGIKADMSELAKEGLAKGYFVDYGLTSGERVGGTLHFKTNALLIDHGVPSRMRSDLDVDAIGRSVEKAGDALIEVKCKIFWNDPAQPDSAGHMVYVTGAEIGADGKTLGLYVNDTGTGEAARFVSADVLSKSLYGWVDLTGSGVEPEEPRFDANVGQR